MSDTVSRADYDRLATQFASLQREVEASRRTPGINPQMLLMNTIGALRGAGFNDDHIEHLRSVFLADKLGATAPMQMQVAASLGPQMVRTQELQQQVKDLADMVTKLTTTNAAGSERAKLKDIISDKSKYPHLAKAYANNPEKYLGALQEGTAEDYAKKLEEQFTDILGPAEQPKGDTSAASVNAETGTKSKQQGTSAQSGLLNDAPPPQAKAGKSGAWTKDTYAAMKAELVAEAEKLVSPNG